MHFTVRRFVAAGAALLVVGSLTVTAPTTPAAAQAPPVDEHGWIDTTDRNAVLAAFADEFYPPVPNPGWSGDVRVCRAGTTSPAYRAAILSRANWYRAMAGAGEPLAERATLTPRAQGTALWASKNWRDAPPMFETNPCYTVAGHRGLTNGFVSLGLTGPIAIDYQVLIGNEAQLSAARRSILDATITSIGLGDIPVAFPESAGEPMPASSIDFGLLDPNRPDQPTREPDTIVTWPPRGYVPGGLVPEVWTVHATGMYERVAADRIEVSVDGEPVEVENLGYGRFRPAIDFDGLEDVDVTVQVWDGGTGADELEHEWTTTMVGLWPKGGTYVPTRSLYRPITPCRVVDTRKGGGPLKQDGIDNAQVSGDGPVFAAQGGTPDGCGVPADATAVEATLTAVNPRLDGYARVGAAAVPPSDANALMFTRGKNRANTLTVPLSAGALGHASLWNPRGTSDYVLDVQGYYVPEAQPGLRYTPVTPCRAADTRRGGGALGSTSNRAFQVRGSGAAFTAQGGTAAGCGIPDDAAAVKTSVTAVPTTSSSGYLRTWASQTSIPAASFLQHAGKGTTVTNTGNVAVGSNGKIALGNRGGSSHYVLDVVGYYSTDGAYAYTPIQACRAVDTRRGVGVFTNRRRAFEVVGSSSSDADRAAFVAQGGAAQTCDIPATAAAVDTTITALDPVGNGNAVVWPSRARQPTIRALNYRSGQWTSNTVAVPTGDQGRIALANAGGRTDYLLELTGYYEP